MLWILMRARNVLVERVCHFHNDMALMSEALQ